MAVTETAKEDGVHWYLAEQLQNDREREVREKVERASRPTARSPRPDLEREIVIRRSAPGDGPAMNALAALDGQQWCRAPALVAEVNGALRAVLPLDGGEPFSDPFHRTSEILALLDLRAKQLNGGARGDRRRFSRLRWAVAR